MVTLEKEERKLSITKSALSGIKILSFAQLAQGNAGVEYLADLGADVIKIERPGKGAWERSWSGLDTYIKGESVFFLSLNRNQRSMTNKKRAGKLYISWLKTAMSSLRITGRVLWRDWDWGMKRCLRSTRE